MNPQLAINILEKSIQHWERIIEWIRKNPGIANREIFNRMLNDIGETFHGDYCACCLYTREYSENMETDCNLCPIPLAGFDKCDSDNIEDDEECDNPYWDIITSSGSRKIQKAIDMRDFLYRVQKYYKQIQTNDNR